MRAAIIVLVQHNILWHATSEDGGEIFEVNIDECLARLRFGRYVWLAEQCFGTLVCLIRLVSQVINKTPLQGASIVQLILDHGKLRPPDIMSRLAPRGSKGTTASAIPSATHLLTCTSRIYSLRSSPARARDFILSQTVDYFVTHLSARQADFVRGRREGEDCRFSNSQRAPPSPRSCDKPPQTRRGRGGESWYSTWTIPRGRALWQLTWSFAETQEPRLLKAL